MQNRNFFVILINTLTMANIILGVLITLLSQAMGNIGQVLEKKGVDMLPKIEDTSAKQNIKNFAKNKIWLLGLILATAAWYVYLPALAFADLSLLSPLAGVGLIILVVFSRYYLKERISKVEVAGMALIIVGVVILGVTITSEGPDRTLDEVNVIFGQAPNLWFTAILIACILVLIAFPILKQYRSADVCFGLAAGLMMGVGGVYSKAFVAGFTGQGVFYALASWPWYIYILMLVFGNMGGTVIQQMGFQHGKAIIVVPLVTILSLFISVLGGLIVFLEWAGLDPVNVTWKIISLLLILIGTAILSFLRTGTTAPQDLKRAEKPTGIGEIAEDHPE
ncbi:MAG TPA: DMT family transporter [Candidatus Lokiarchaeia archaeon]|nr:DMT family transporter [Candidatus Lokiarchaeia archaeon]